MMTEAEKRQIKAFLDNRPMAEAVRKAIQQTLTTHGDIAQLDTALDDAAYGRAVKSTVLASQWLTEAFASLAQLAKPAAEGKQKNEAR